ncbi:MAG: Na+/H+ antiporter NhaA, partial [Bauldia sp.]
ATSDFVGWGPSAGLLLLFATVVALIVSNTNWGESFLQFWETEVGLSFGSGDFHMSLLHWINDGLLTIFFLVVGLEIKREFTVGHLANRRAAALPIAAAIGGMAIPIGIYLAVIPTGPWADGWGMVMATDTAFAIALMVLLGNRIPVELRVFLTAAAIIDDVGAVLVVTFFYSDALSLPYLLAAGLVTLALATLNRTAVYRLAPYLVLGVILWFCVYSAGIHATLAGIILALFVPTRPPANLPALMTQANAIIASEAKHEGEVLRTGPSEPALRALDEINDRLESPADRLLRRAGARSSYFVLPVFALANAGVVITGNVFEGHGTLIFTIIAGLALGKPVGFLLASFLAVRFKIATKPSAYSWRQLLGAGALAGIGFTMSLFIASQGLPDPEDFAAAKIAIFLASIVAAVVGVALLWNAERRRVGNTETDDHTAV